MRGKRRKRPPRSLPLAVLPVRRRSSPTRTRASGRERPARSSWRRGSRAEVTLSSAGDPALTARRCGLYDSAAMKQKLLTSLLMGALVIGSTGCVKKMLLNGQIHSTRVGSGAADTIGDYE